MTSSGYQLPLDIKLRDDATFANYVGEARHRLDPSNSVTYLWGAPGTGRSHLLQAACHHAEGLGQRALYLCEPSHYPAEVLSGLEQLDLVCIDDLEEIVGKRDWEVALFHLVNAVRDHGGRMIVSSYHAPRELAIELADLRSRLLAAPALETDRLDDDQKLEVLTRKARGKGFDMNDEVGRFIISRSPRDMRDLILLLERLEVETLRQQKRVTIPLVKSLIDTGAITTSR